MAFGNIGSAELESASSLATDSISATVPDLGANSIGLVWVCQHSGAATLTVSSVTWGGQAMSNVPGSTIDDGTRRVSLYQKANPLDNGSQTISVNWSAATSKAAHIVAVWADATNAISLDDTSETSGTLTQNPTITSTQASSNEFVVSASVSAANALGAPTTTDCTELQTWDSGGNCSIVAYSTPVGSGDATHTHRFSQSESYVIASVSFQESGANNTPTIALNTADDTTFSTTTPTVEFTGTDTESDSIRYNIQITDNSFSFASGTVLAEEIDTGGTGNLTIHTNPTGGTTWEGHNQIDDRVGQVFQGHGGVLDSVAFNFSAFESNPALTDGSYLVRVYNVDSGVRGDNVSVWQAATAYSAGNIVRNTSTANADQQFLYVCSVGGTSGGAQPAFTEVENDTITDNTVTWVAHRGAGPASSASAASTPTSGWLAESGVTAYNPGVVDSGWKTSTFSGANRIRLANGTWYVAVLDWRPANTTSDNGITVVVRQNGTHGGNCYLDGGSSSNNGPRVGDDTKIRIYESYVLLDKVSGTDAGFANTVTGGDTDPFNSGEKASYTVQAGDALSETEYYWRARAIDPAGSNTYSAWATARSFTVDILDTIRTGLLTLLGCGRGTTSS
jgi:hypothetical protein